LSAPAPTLEPQRARQHTAGAEGRADQQAEGRIRRAGGRTRSCLSKLVEDEEANSDDEDGPANAEEVADSEEVDVDGWLGSASVSVLHACMLHAA
jgi:hypothetical protein